MIDWGTPLLSRPPSVRRWRRRHRSSSSSPSRPNTPWLALTPPASSPSVIPHVIACLLACPGPPSKGLYVRGGVRLYYPLVRGGGTSSRCRDVAHGNLAKVSSLRKKTNITQAAALDCRWAIVGGYLCPLCGSLSSQKFGMRHFHDGAPPTPTRCSRGELRPRPGGTRRGADN